MVVTSVVIYYLWTPLFAALLAFAALIRYNKLRKSWKSRPIFNQFQTNTAATYSAPKGLVSAAPANNEAVDEWLGPIARAGWNSGSTTAGSKETVKNAENTLLFTPTQAIAIMLAPADAANLSEGVLGRAASAFLAYSPQSASGKGTRFRGLHAKHWDELMAPLLEMPLSSILQTHFNYSIPYSKVQSVEVKTGKLKFHLMDGSTLRYQVLGREAKDQIREIERYLQQRVTEDASY